MKLSAILCASILALTALTLTADGAFAATTIKGSKSNTMEKIDSSATAAKACTDKGGTVFTDKNGAKMCVMPGAEWTSTVKSSKSNTMDMAAADTDKSCTDKGGFVATDKDGGRHCITPSDACRTMTFDTSKPGTVSQIRYNRRSGDVADATACLDACGKITTTAGPTRSTSTCTVLVPATPAPTTQGPSSGGG